MKTEAIRAACVRRFGAWAVSAAVLSGTTWMAHAASFDCAKARSPQELLICSDPEHSRLDREMGEAYRQHASRLSERARARVLASQRAWLVFWPRSCSRASQQIRLGVEELPCARDRYRERLAELWPVIPAPGLQSYVVVERRYLPPAFADESPGRHEIKFPQVEVVTPQQAAPS